MKTSVVMQRPMGQFIVQQRSKDGFFNASNLLKQWNEANPNKERRLDHFFETTHLGEFMEEIVKDPANNYNSNSPNFGELKSALTSASSGRYGGTWMQPYLFVKFAMYLNPAFEYQVVKFVADELIKQRNNSGDSYKVMCARLKKSFSHDSYFKDFIKDVAIAVRAKCNVADWQQASEAQLAERDELHRRIATFAEVLPPDEAVRHAIGQPLQQIQ